MMFEIVLGAKLNAGRILTILKIVGWFDTLMERLSKVCHCYVIYYYLSR